MASPRKRGKGKERPRLYWRERNGVSRAYGDFRDYGAYGGRLEALIPVNEKQATRDPDIAAVLLADRLKELEALRRGRVLVKLRGDGILSHLVERHLKKKRESGKVTDRWLTAVEGHLQTAVDFFEREKPGDAKSAYVPRDMATIMAADVRDYVGYLRTLTSNKKHNGEPATISDGTVRVYLVSLSNAFRRAIEEGIVPLGHNPVAALMEKPQQRSEEARWLEIHEAALLLEAARLHKPSRGDGIRCMYPLIATMLLTGGRMSEVLGLTVDDVSFDRRTVTFRPHPHRRLKTETSHRAVKMWPQLEEILHDYVFGCSLGTMLFPAAHADVMIDDIRKSLDTIAGRAGWKPGEIRTKMLRHTYCSARLQTLDEGAPVSPFTVAREMGHGGDSLVKKVYGHLGTVRHRSEFVEYRVGQHREKLAERLPTLHLASGEGAPLP